jgi:mRNA interferase RelE/StbE
LPKKTRHIVVGKILDLREDPFPNGNKEKLDYPHPPAVYRLYVSRSFTVFYIIASDENVIKIEEIMTIERAHKEYSRRK